MLLDETKCNASINLGAIPMCLEILVVVFRNQEAENPLLRSNALVRRLERLGIQYIILFLERVPY